MVRDARRTSTGGCRSFRDRSRHNEEFTARLAWPSIETKKVTGTFGTRKSPVWQLRGQPCGARDHLATCYFLVPNLLVWFFTARMGYVRQGEGWLIHLRRESGMPRYSVRPKNSIVQINDFEFL